MKNNFGDIGDTSSCKEINSKKDIGCEIESLAEERAQRVRLVRRMTGLTRVALSKKYGVSASNFQNWEGPRYGGLTEKAARILAIVCGKEGVEVTVEWLMYGSGMPPAIVYKPLYSQLEVKGHENNYATTTTYEQEAMPQEKRSVELAKIAQELELFKQNYNHDVLVTVVTDKAMEPIYKIGDYIAGKRHTNIAAFLQNECIVELSDRKLLVRVLEPGNEDRAYNLVSSNTDIRPNIVRNVKILSVAPVMWIRRMENNY
jgi:DNA-binding transcriptional regulator YiaG